MLMLMPLAGGAAAQAATSADGAVPGGDGAGTVGSWSQQTFLADPALYRRYQADKLNCSWTPPLPLAQFNRPPKHKATYIWHINGANAFARSCTTRSVRTERGTEQRFYTRVEGLSGKMSVNVRPAGPAVPSGSLLLEAFQGLYDTTGKPMPFPPVHPQCASERSHAGAEHAQACSSDHVPCSHRRSRAQPLCRMGRGGGEHGPWRRPALVPCL
jgi:hypothetical protein